MNLWTDKWTPLLLKEENKPFDNDNYIFEVKFDGIRAIVFATPKKVTIKSRNGKNLTSLFPELQEIKKLVTENTIFDGEIIALENSCPSFAKIQNRLHLKNASKIIIQSKTNPIIFMCFDILYKKKDLTNLPLIKRKEILNQTLDNDTFIKVKFIEKNGVKLFNAIKKIKLEGIVAKQKNSLYEVNKRVDSWIKIKNVKRKQFYIIGYIENKMNISLLLAEQKKKVYFYVGKVSITRNNNLYEKIKKEKIVKNKVKNCEEEANFISIKLKCTIRYLEKTKEGILRHPNIEN